MGMHLIASNATIKAIRANDKRTRLSDGKPSPAHSALAIADPGAGELVDRIGDDFGLRPCQREPCLAQFVRRGCIAFQVHRHAKIRCGQAARRS
jgi:hypothetical protein